MTRLALVDVNVLLPLLLPQHAAHLAAARWVQAQPSGRLRFALPVQLAVLRLLSQPRVMGAGVLSPESALEIWGQLVEATGMKELHAAQPGHATLLASLIAGRAATPSLWTDAWLAALARSHDGEMVTFDQGFRSFPGLMLNLLQA
jgi:hypothetical protein